MRKLLPLLIALFLCQAALSQGSAFTYQGKLTDGGTAANGTYDLRFRLFDQAVAGSQVGPDDVKEDVTAAAGIFTVTLDFGTSPFTTASGNFLEISVRPGASTGAFTPLNPRQPITSSPYAVQTIRAASAAVADNANALGGTPAAQFTQNDDPRLSDARPPQAGSPNYIQNGTGVQPLSNFNISGNGTVGGDVSANAVNSETAFSINSMRVLQRSFSGNRLFVGANTGFANSNGFGVTVVGEGAGAAHTSGNHNALFGSNAGAALTTGNDNSFFGSNAGTQASATTGNSFFGTGSGSGTTTGSNNSFFGKSAGASNTTGQDNSIFGSGAGAGSTGSGNSFFGSGAGLTTSGGTNTFVGSASGQANGAGESNVFIGALSGQSNTTGSENAYIGFRSGRALVAGDRNVAVGSNAGQAQTGGSDNTFVGAGATAFGNVSNSTAIGAGALVSTSNTMVLGNFFGTTAVNIPGSLSVSGAFSANGQSFNNLNASNITSGTLSNARLGIIPTVNGGTGASSSGPAGNVLRSDGKGWNSSALQAADISDGSTAFIVNSASSQSASFNVTGNGNVGGTLSGNTVNAVTQYNISGSRMMASPGTANTFVGRGSGLENTVGSRNTIIGTDAGYTNTSGTDNTYLGYEAKGNPEISFATAIGSGAFATSSNTVVLGTVSETVEVPGSLTVAGSARASQIEMLGLRVFKQQAGGNLFVGSATGSALTTGTENSFLSINTGNLTTIGNGNTFAGHSAGMGTTTGSRNSFFGYRAGAGNDQGIDNLALGSYSSLAPAIGNATAIGHRAFVTQSNSVILGSINGVNGATSSASVGIGTTSPSERLHVVGNTFLQGNTVTTGTSQAIGLIRSTSGIYISQPSTLIITSPNGACWGITVSNSGAVGAFSTPCP
jgi:hypothetical protein